jgi:shikimate O-hydroxycinnamoyltransferase
MPISPLDAYEDHFPVGYVAFYRQTLSPSLLTRALTQVLPDYPLLTGRISRDARGHKAIALNDAGLDFEVQEVPDTLSDWRDPDRNAIGRFVRVLLPQSPLRCRQPLMSLRLTQLAGGGSVLGIGFGHVLADGNGIAGFLRDWAKAARGEPVVAPLWDRVEQAKAFRVDGFDPGSVPVHEQSYLGLHEGSLWELAHLYQHLLRALPGWVGYTIPLRGEDIEKLKAATNAGRSEALSSNDILSAFLWKLYAGALVPYGAHRSRFFGVADLRKHTPGVPARGVFGCMSGHLLLEGTTKSTLDLDLYQLAQRIRRETRGIRPERFLQQEEWLRHRQTSGRMHRVLAALPYPGDVAVSNCRYIPFYDMDFGGGRPYFFNLPAEKFPRIVVWPAADGDGCVLNLHLTREMAGQILPVLTRRGALTPASVERRERSLQ